MIAQDTQLKKKKGVFQELLKLVEYKGYDKEGLVLACSIEPYQEELAL